MPAFCANAGSAHSRAPAGSAPLRPADSRPCRPRQDDVIQAILPECLHEAGHPVLPITQQFQDGCGQPLSPAPVLAAPGKLLTISSNLLPTSPLPALLE